MTFHAKLFAGHRHDHGLLEQELRHFNRIVAESTDIGQGIERSRRRDQAGAIEGAHFLQDDIPVVLDLQAQRLDHGLQAVQCPLGRRLRQGRHTRRGLGHDVGHHPHQLTRRHHPADTETGHAIELRHPVDHDHIRILDIPFGELIGRDGPHPVEGQLVIDIVADHEDALLLAQAHDLLDQLRRVDRPRRIVRAVDDDRPCRRRHCPLDVFEARGEGPIFRRDDDGDPQAHPDHLGVRHPVGSDHDHFVLRVQYGIKDIVERLFGPVGHDHVLRCDQAVVAFLGITDDRLLHRGQAVGRGVFDLSAGQLCGRGQDGCDRSFVLGLPDPQVDDGFAALAQETSFLVQRKGRRFGDLTRQFAELH